MLKTSLSMAAAVLALSAALAHGQTQRLELAPAQVSAIVPEDSTEGKTFVLAVSLPEAPAGARLMSAILELVVDANTVLPAAVAGGGVTLEVYPLANAISESAIEAEDLLPATMKRTVPLGPDRPVRVDVTEFVRLVLADPSANHGLAVGSLTSNRTGRFELKADGASGTLATLTLHYLPVENASIGTPAP